MMYLTKVHNLANIILTNCGCWVVNVRAAGSGSHSLSTPLTFVNRLDAFKGSA